jgi:hypothetical protein
MANQSGRKNTQANNNQKPSWPATYGKRVKGAFQAAADFLKGLVGRK